MLLPATLLLARGQLIRTRVIYVCLFGENAAIVVKLADFVARIQEEKQMILDYVLRDATLRPHTPSLLFHWVKPRLANWLEKQ